MPTTTAAHSITPTDKLLTQAIEGAGSMDREAITAHLKSHTYQTMLGEYDMRNQLLNRLYTAGQWQGGGFTRSPGSVTRIPTTFPSN